MSTPADRTSTTVALELIESEGWSLLIAPYLQYRLHHLENLILNADEDTKDASIRANIQRHQELKRLLKELRTKATAGYKPARRSEDDPEQDAEVFSYDKLHQAFNLDGRTPPPTHQPGDAVNYPEETDFQPFSQPTTAAESPTPEKDETSD